jgi:acyl-CoA reductase-like NAD-dependent aldehyde dehydrogenase
LKVGDPWDPVTDLGPVVSDRAAARILALVADAAARGARILRAPRAVGRVIQPTVIADAPEGTRLLQEEVFGPVIVLIRAASAAEAFEIANATPFGLQASCFTRDLASAFQAFDQIDVGSLWINEASRFRLDNYPFGGAKQSGFGREGVRSAMEEFTQAKFLGLSFPNPLP